MWVLDKTKTAMGQDSYTDLEQPLINMEDINDRLDTIDQLCKNTVSRDEIREYLNPIYDLERLLRTSELQVRKSTGFNLLCELYGNASLISRRFSRILTRSC